MPTYLDIFGVYEMADTGATFELKRSLNGPNLFEDIGYTHTNDRPVQRK